MLHNFLKTLHNSRIFELHFNPAKATIFKRRIILLAVLINLITFRVQKNPYPLHFSLEADNDFSALQTMDMFYNKDHYALHIL